MIANIKNSLGNLVVALCLLLLFSCHKNEQYYYFAYFTDKDGSVPESYIIKEITTNKKQRSETNFMFTPKGELKSKSVNVFQITNTGLKKQINQQNSYIFKPYLDIRSNEYINFKYTDESLNDFASTSFCFVGEKNLTLDNKKYANAYRFKKEQGKINTVTSFVYLDRNFVLILEEFIEGERPYYRIERIDSTLTFMLKK